MARTIEKTTQTQLSEPGREDLRLVTIRFQSADDPADDAFAREDDEGSGVSKGDQVRFRGSNHKAGDLHSVGVRFAVEVNGTPREIPLSVQAADARPELAKAVEALMKVLLAGEVPARMDQIESGEVDLADI